MRPLVTALAAALPGNARLPSQIPDCSDVPSSHPEQPVPRTNASSLAVAGNWEVRQDVCHPPGEAAHVSCPPECQPRGWCWAVVWGTVALGSVLCPLHGSRRLGYCPGPAGLGKALGAVPELGHCWSRGHEDSLPPDVPTYVKGCQVRASFACHCSQGCHPAHLGSQGHAGVWCLLPRGCSKKGMSRLDVILGEACWDVLVPAGMGAAELGSAPCWGTHQCSPHQPWHCLILIKGWMVPELQKCSAHSVACPCP